MVRRLSGESKNTVWRYSPIAGHWDEAVLPSGLPRRAWRPLASSLRRIGIAEIARRWEEGSELIAANGVTYNIYGSPEGSERPWPVDPIPMLVGGKEWEHIERAVAQRAELLNRILADLYGAQRLLKERQLPASLVFANSAFLRPCVGIEPVGGAHISTYAADLARSPDGKWWVISDRTQNPSGMGYALENRFVSARTLAPAFDCCRVRPLVDFFDLRRVALQEMARSLSPNPRIVVLTPGPGNETYFEHSYLARQWGFTLVEGSDLTVRNQRVYLKTLAGLEQVDVIVRRVDDTFSDPVEFRTDSLLGVPGLAQVARSGGVVISNALGSGLAETPALMGFLPKLCETLIGESLAMPSVATWWCGERSALEYVSEHLEQVVIKPLGHRAGIIPAFPEQMSKPERAALLAKIQASPESFVAQEQVALSTIPTRTESGVSPRHVVLRVFAVWTGHGFAVMPGGLTRVSPSPTSLVVSMQAGGGSKDTWILGCEGPGCGLDHREETQFTPVATELPSRVADNLFWLGRYSERLEGGVRFVRGLLPALSSETDFGGASTLESASALLCALGYLPEEFEKGSLQQRRWNVEQLLSGMVYDSSRLTGLGLNVGNMRRVALPLKGRLSNDTWRILQRLDNQFAVQRPLRRENRLSAQMTLLDDAIVTLSALAGLLMENTTRGPGWRFLQVGKRLERALQLLNWISATFETSDEHTPASMRTLLQIADSSITYRSRYFSTLRPDLVLQLLVKDDRNPRSILFQLEALVELLSGLPGYSGAPEPPPLRLAKQTLHLIMTASAATLAEVDEEAHMPALGDLFTRIKGLLFDISDELSALHFNHLPSLRMASL